MKRRLLLFTIMMIVGALGCGHLYAQKDVTALYIKNANLSNGLTGWTVSNFNTPQRGNNTIGYATESYAGWNDLAVKAYSLTQKIKLPKGRYTLVNYSFYREKERFNDDPNTSRAFLKAGDQEVPVKTLGSIQANGYANSQADGANAFDSKMYRNTLDFTISSDNTEIEIGLYGTFENIRSWVIAGMFELIDLDKEATMDAPFDVTGYLVNPGFEYRDMTGWTLSEDGAMGAQGNTAFASKAGGYYAEKWQASGGLPDRSMSQDLSGLPNGFYLLSAYAFYGGTGAYLKLNDKQVEITAGKEGKYTVGCVINDGKLHVEAGVKDGTSNWVCFDRFTLSYCGDLNKALTDLCASVTKYQGLIPETIYNKLVTDVNAYNKSYGDVDEYIAAIAAVNELFEQADVSVKSYSIIAAGEVPTSSLDGWTCTNSNLFQVNTWSDEGVGDGTGMVTPFIENWVARDQVLGDGKVYYTLSGLVPGEVYYAQALVRAYSEAGNVPNGPNFFINDQITDMTTAGTAFTYYYKKATLSGIYGTLGGTAVVGEDGTLTIGVVIENANYNWVAFKNVHIQSMEDALQAAIDRVKAYSGKVPAGIQALIDNIEANVASTFDLTTAEGYEKAIKFLTEVAEQLPGYALAYEKYLQLKDKGTALVAVESDNANALNELKAAMASAEQAVNLATSQETIDNARASLFEAMASYVAVANPTGDGRFDCTFLLATPNLEGFANESKAEGWFTDQPDGNSQVMTNADATSEDGTKTTFFEYWSSEPKANNLFTLYQKLTLAPGIYNMTCYAFAQQPIAGDVRGVKFFANDTEGSTIESNRLSEASIEFVQTEEGEVKIGLKAVEGNTYRWMGIGYVELYKLSNVKEASISNADVNAPAPGAYTTINANLTLKKGLNTIVLPFATNKDEIGASMVLKYEGTEIRDNGKPCLLFTEVEELAANTPYAVFMDADTQLKKFENKTVVAPTNLTVSDAYYNFVGTFTAYDRDSSPIKQGDYIAGVNEFKKANGGNTIKAYHAYMEKTGLNDGADDYEPLLCINGMILDGISTVSLSETTESNRIFNLNGQMVTNPQKGVYIINGKKVIIK